MENRLYQIDEKSEMRAKLQLNKIFYQLLALTGFVIFVVWYGRTILGFEYILMYLCLWFFGATVMVLVYSENYIVNSIVVSATSLMSIFSIYKATALVFDYVHIPPMIMAFTIVILHKPISLKLLWAVSGVATIWYAIVGGNFIYFGYPSVLNVAFIQLVNAGCITLIMYSRTHETPHLLKRFSSLIYTSGILTFSFFIAISIY